MCRGCSFTVCPKADAIYPIVSAASIVAKVRPSTGREHEQKELVHWVGHKLLCTLLARPFLDGLPHPHVLLTTAHEFSCFAQKLLAPPSSPTSSA